ncbi:hypothetical protein LGT39_12420 [Demequina sp. TTPB684]|uniref:hypothetical protein n=1 Tax=unclassified Demequina TaxID=2620311 RepID=UPI001CF3BA37|nr:MULTISPECIES: hypothetical protein [unclassified Demequina]MCB2413649.1 hypothetical protein [Demequina sp. TTPB684]UPU87712.1 hypothetical protein LGT36_010675 [Demequina sp. TMPB413]
MATSDASLYDVKTNLRAVVDDLKAISPKLARDMRRSLRETGESIIEEQQSILASVPVGATVSRTRYTMAQPSRRGGYRRGPRARQLAGARIIGLDAQASARGYHTGLRDQVASNLTTQVRTPRTGRGAAVRVASAKPFWGNKALNAKTWEHPVFAPRGTRPYAKQAGNQYFQRGVAGGIVEAREALIAVVDEAAKLIKSHPVE